MEKNIQNRIKRFKKVVNIIGLILVAGGFSAMSLLVVVNSDNSPKYEFYDVYGYWGTSSECGESKEGNLVCLIENNYIPVSQYSKLKKGDDLDVWKK